MYHMERIADAVWLVAAFNIWRGTDFRCDDAARRMFIHSLRRLMR